MLLFARQFAIARDRVTDLGVRHTMNAGSVWEPRWSKWGWGLKPSSEGIFPSQHHLCLCFLASLLCLPSSPMTDSSL